MLIKRNSFRHGNSGFTIVELMVGVAVLAILVTMAVPSFRAMMQSNRVRNAASAILDGLQLARSEAISRNQNVAFVLGAGTDASWTVNIVATGSTVATRTAIDDAKGVVRTTLPAGATTATFNGFGSITPNADGSASLTAVSTAIAGNHEIRVMIEGSKVRMCNPRIAADTSPRGC